MLRVPDHILDNILNKIMTREGKNILQHTEGAWHGIEQEQLLVNNMI